MSDLRPSKPGDAELAGKFGDLESSLERVYAALDAGDYDEAFGAMTFTVIGFYEVLGNSDVFAKTFPVLESIKNAILERDYDAAVAPLLALLAKMRSVQQTVAEGDGR